MIQFDLPKEQSSIIKVIGVGGGGSNAVNHMFEQNIEGVNFVICNTDAQAIAQSKVPNKIQLGPHLTQGLGAGANPSVGRKAMEESLEEIRAILEVNTKMAFITAGMGGGTGTGGAPILAKICKDLGILTVGIVTTPFAYEGKKRLNQAEEGINLLKDHVDTLLVISNDKLRHQFGNLKMKEAFGRADNVLATAAKCITDVINSTGQINVDFADVCTVMRNGGVAILGSATAEGANRAQTAIENALTSPLLNDSDIKGAKWILININSAEGEHEFTMDEVEVIQNHLLSQAGEETDVILGLGYDNTLGSQIGITIIATGFEHKDPFQKQVEVKTETVEKFVLDINTPVVTTEAASPNSTDASNESAAADVAVETPMAIAAPEVVTLTEMVVVDTSFQDIPVELMPVLSTPEKIEEVLEEKEIKIEEEPMVFAKSEDEIPVFFELSIESETVSLQNNIESQVSEPIMEVTPELENEASNNSTLSSGGYLVRPKQIYAEETGEQESLPAVNGHAGAPAPTGSPVSNQTDESELDMQLVEKTQFAAEDEPIVQQTQPIMMSPIEDPATQDEIEENRRRAMERIAKLRNLSFNINAADPNNEFETVPAYLRRNMEINNQIANVETFYSNYVVKTNENNQAEINSLNTFLDGNRPD